MFLIAFIFHNYLQSAQAGNQLQVHYTEYDYQRQYGKYVCKSNFDLLWNLLLHLVQNRNLVFHLSHH